MENTRGKTAIVTGGASGIGKATVQLFLEGGATVVVVDSDSDNLKKLSQECNSQKLYTYVIDISDADAVAGFFGVYQDPVDILINNAGIDLTFKHGSQQFDIMRKIMQVNFLGSVYMTDYAVQRMKDLEGGSIVFVSTIHTALAFLGDGAYKPAKHAMIGYMQSIATEMAQHNIRANAVAPGFIFPTGINNPAKLSSDIRSNIAKNIPLNQWGTPQNIAEAILFAATQPYLNGEEIRVDGGLPHGNIEMDKVFKNYLKSR